MWYEIVYFYWPFNNHVIWNGLSYMQADKVYYLAIYDFHVHTPKEGEVLTLTEDNVKTALTPQLF